MNIIFPLSVVDGIMGGGYFLCMNSCMFARMYIGPISLYMYVGVHACMCVRLAKRVDKKIGFLKIEIGFLKL